MSWTYSVVFLVLAVACIVLSLGLLPTHWTLALLCAYTAGAFLLMALAYAGVGPRLLLKQPSGAHHPVSCLLLGPYLLLTRFSLLLYRTFSREPAYVEVASNLYFGRRLTTTEAQRLCALGCVGVLDLAPELAEVQPLRQVRHYRSLPVLDATAPRPEQLEQALAWLEEVLREGPVYVHCALGHGRSATIVIGHLLRTASVATVREGLQRLRTLRPGVKLLPAQRQLVLALEST